MTTRSDSRDPDRLSRLWARYKRGGDQSARNLLLESYLPLVRYSAERIALKLPDEVDVDDLVSAGIFGLMDAIDAFDLARSVKFETYVAPRIGGAILDELRSLDWVPRLVRSRSAKLSAARQRALTRLGRSPSDREVADELGLGPADFVKIVRDAEAVGLVSLNEQWFELRAGLDIGSIPSDSGQWEVPDERGPGPAETASSRDFKAFLTRGLSRAERLILVLYYYEEMTMKEIAVTLDLSESRVSQMHSSILGKLKHTMARRGKASTLSEITVTDSPAHRERNLTAVSDAVSMEPGELLPGIPANPAIEVYLDPGSASATDIASLFTAIDGVYRSLGGAGLRIWGGETHATLRAEAWV